MAQKRSTLWLELPVRLVTLSLLAVAGAGCNATKAAPAPPRTITFHTGPTSGAYWRLGEAIANVYNTTIPESQVNAVVTDTLRGAGGNAESIESGEADLAFSRSDVAAAAFRVGSGPDERPYTHVRAMAVLYANAVHVVVRRGSGIKTWRDIPGKRVQISDEVGTAGGTLARRVLEAHGIRPDDVEIVSNPRDAIPRLKAGEMDVRIFASAYPLPTIDDVGEASELRLLSIEPEAADRLRSSFPFFKNLIIPKDTYRGQAADLRTVGIDGLLICRDSLPESLVYEMTKRLFEALPELARAQPAARLINVARAPATPVPLHPGAARYYREQDLFR